MSTFSPLPSTDPVQIVEHAGSESQWLEHLSFVVVGHVDHGKSTLIGRLLFDTNSVPEGHIERIQAACKASGRAFEFAFLLDALLEEQAQNVTMDTTRVPFRTERRRFTIIDAPGHKEFLKNMITGAASADAAVLVVDAQAGIGEQTRRHGYLLSLLGVQQVVVAVNKMDLIGYSQSAFERISAELAGFLGQINVRPTHVVPTAAKHGSGLCGPSDQMAWYRGPAILEILGGYRASPPLEQAPLRLSVQGIYRFDARRIIAGKVESGRIAVGDQVEVHPGGKQARVKAIERWPAAAVATEGGLCSTAPANEGAVIAGRSIAFTLDEEVFVERGHVISTPEHGPQNAREFNARLFWLNREPLRTGETLSLRLTTQCVDARVVSIARTLNTATLETSRMRPDLVAHNEAAEVHIRTRRPLIFDTEGAPALGRFVLIRNGRIAGGGVIEAPRPYIYPEQGFPITARARETLLGHGGAVIWLTGLSGAGKSTLAVELERRLLRSGVLPVILDGDVLRAGLCQGLGFSEADRKENIRRAAEAAVLVAESGAVVITALISPFRSEREHAAERCRSRGIPFAEVFVNAPLSECERRDPKQLYRRARAGEIASFTGISSPYEPPLMPALELKTDQETVAQAAAKLESLALSLVRPDPRLRYLAQLIGPQAALKLTEKKGRTSAFSVFASTFEAIIKSLFSGRW